jgi:hypothetical protein
MKYSLLLSFFLFAVTSSSISQDSSGLLKNYKFRTLGLRALQLNINATGNLYDAKRVNGTDVNGSDINSNIVVNYFRITSTNKRQHLSTISISPVFNFSKNKNVASINRSRNARLDMEWNRTDRFFNKQNFFFEIGNELAIDGYSQSHTSAFNDNRVKYGMITDKLILGLGKGRLENVQDAQMAIFIINDLRRLGLLTEEPDAATQYQLAELITDINNRRVFDNRVRRIYELTRIDSFLQSKHLITTPTIAYFTAVNDNWALAFNPGRVSGTRIYAQLKPGFNLNFEGFNQSDTSTLSYKGDTKQFIYFYEPEIGVEYQKPVSLHWQRTANASLRFRQRFARTSSKTESSSVVTETEHFTTSPELVFNSFYGVGYYPNNRTVVNAGVNFEAVFGTMDMGIRRPDYFVLAPGLQLNANYFLNYRTRIFLTAGLNYKYAELKDDPPVTFVYDKNLFTSNFNIGFAHFIF